MGEVHPSSNFLLFAASLAITFFVFPSFLNLPSQIFPSLAVEKSWDFLILALVVLAIAYGFLSISNHVGDGRWLGSYGSSDTQKSSLSNPIPLSECYGSGRFPNLRVQDEGRRGHHDHTHLDVVQGSGSKTVHSRGRKKGDRNEEAKQFQSKEATANDYCDRNAAVKEKRTYHPLEEKSKKKRGGLATNESSGSLKTKKKDRRRERKVHFDDQISADIGADELREAEKVHSGSRSDRVRNQDDYNRR